MNEEVLIVIIVFCVGVYALFHGIRIVFLKKMDLEIPQLLYLLINKKRFGVEKTTKISKSLVAYNKKINIGFWNLFGGVFCILWVLFNIIISY